MWFPRGFETAEGANYCAVVSVSCQGIAEPHKPNWPFFFPWSLLTSLSQSTVRPEQDVGKEDTRKSPSRRAGKQKIKSGGEERCPAAGARRQENDDEKRAAVNKREKDEGFG